MALRRFKRVKFKPTFGRKQLAALLGAALAVATGLCLHSFRFGKGLANYSYDLLLVSRGDTKVNEAVIVYLDEVSYQKLDQPLNAPWDRALHAKLIDRLSAAGAKAIVFDVVFSDPNPAKAEADQQLADAIRRSGRVVLAADNVPIGPKTKQMIPPFELLMNEVAGVGSAETIPSSDLIIRIHTPRGDNALPSLTWAAAETVKLPVTQQPGAENVERWLNYYGRPGLISWRSYYKALDTRAVRDDFFRDKVVFVGARIITKNAGDRKDEYPSPFSVWLGYEGFMSGVEIQATAFLNLLRGDWLERFPSRVETLILIVLGLVFGVSLLLCRPLAATAIAGGGFALVLAGSYLLFRQKLIWFPFLIVAAQISIALGWSVLFNSVQLYVQKRLFEQTLSLYLSPKLVKKFSGNPNLLKVGAEKHTLTLFFSDIANFTSISEGMDSDHLALMMNQYFEDAVSKCIHKTDGTVVKYIGDAIFAFWNAPEPQDDHAVRACEAVLHFRKDGSHNIDGKELRTRIGLHSGLANVGNFGSAERVDYTALGENVNLASRLEGLNKYLGTMCLMSGDTKQLIGDHLITRFAGRFRLKGFEKAVDVHELVGWTAEEAESKPWREAYADALAAFQRGDFDSAENGFRRTIELHPADGPSEFHLARIAELRRSKLSPTWNGEIELKEK